MYISYIVGVGGGCQNNNPFEAEKSSSMDKKDNYNTEAVEELIVNWRKLMLQQETQEMHIVNFYFCFNTLIINLLSDILEKMPKFMLKFWPFLQIYIHYSEWGISSKSFHSVYL